MKKLSRPFSAPPFLAAILALATIVAGAYSPPAAEAQPLVRYDDLPDLAEYVLDGRKWGHTNLTYFFQNGTSDIGGDDERQAIRDAFALWAGVTSLTFTEVSSASSADIVILWAVGNHGDGSSFDGVNGVLAHAFYPPPNGGSLAGDAHFDDSETWTLGFRSDGNQPIDLMTVAAHEIGHSLGLGHSQVPGALMYAFYGGSHRFLDQDDVNGIQALYPRPSLPPYLGCFTDSEPRALPYWLGNVNDIGTCVNLAYNSGLAYAGLQWYGECWGGNELRYTQVGDWECNTPCASGQTCGGAWRNSIYATGHTPPGGGMQPDSAVRGCSNWSWWSPVYQPDPGSCYNYCLQNGANSCEWNQNGDCYVEFASGGCYVQGGFPGWWAAVF